MDEMKNFANTLSASMAGLDHESYVDRMIEDASLLAEFQKQVDKVCKIKITPENFKDFRSLNGELTSLFCFMYNNNFSEEKRKELGVIQKKLNQHMISAARKLSRNGCTPEVLPIVKYATGASRYYRDENFEATMKLLLDAGLLYKKPYTDGDGNLQYQFVSTGMHLAVGDNTFGVSWRNGKQYRLYVNVIVPMCFPVSQRYKKACNDMLSEIPVLPNCYEAFTIENDRKNCAKVSIPYKDRQVIQKFVVDNMNRGY